ncbi:MAG: transmembrane domain-containing protein [Gemmatimonadetes bacterium]|nr:transmembrane domain-containing protein [Gemmatimonadota bacterium]
MTRRRSRIAEGHGSAFPLLRLRFLQPAVPGYTGEVPMRFVAGLAAPALLLWLSACIPGDPNSPQPPSNPLPLSAQWSDPAAWPNGRLPAAGAEVVIERGRTITLDVSPPALRGLIVEGTLEFDRKDLSLTSDWILVRGTLRIGTEAQPFTHNATITLTGPATDQIEGMGGKVLAVLGGALELHGTKRVTWTRLAATAAVGATRINVLGPIDWRTDDHIVVASSDFDPLRAEEGFVTAVQGTQVTLRSALRYQHWGDLQTFGGRSLDERAEVGLLSRNIVVQGDSASLTAGFGGHIFATGRSTMHVEGVELRRMGQKQVLARYPMHWHMEGDVNGQYFRDNAVWKSFNRCVTVHGSNNAVVARNVCWDHLGHGYFLEDGAETGNTFESNLGLVSRRAAAGQELLPSDTRPATFWITNPANTYRNNVAAGSQGFGFWYALPAAPTGHSTGSPARPRSTPLGEFSDNVAHSNQNTGLQVDDGPRADGTTETTSYAPRQTPGNTSSPAVTAFFRNFTGYKHAGRAVWLRGAQLRLSGAMLADNHIGATFASNETFLMDAVVVGFSANAVSTFSVGFPVRGYEFYDGRVGAEQATFVNFQPTPANRMSALGFNRRNSFSVDTRNYVKLLTFQNANQVLIEDPDPIRDGDKAAVFLDEDGSVTGTAGNFVAANNPLLITPSCIRRDAWNAYVCTNRFVRLHVRGGDNQAIAPISIARDDAATATFVGVPDSPHAVYSSVPTQRGYTVNFASGTPAKPQIYVYGMAPSDWVRVSFAYPSGSINVYRDSDVSRSIPAAATLAELDAGTGDRYFYDTPTGTVHLKLLPRAGRDQATMFVQSK